jgi:hypothetical protein
LPLGDDPRDALLSESTVFQLATLRRIDRASYESQLLFARSAVDREWEARKRIEANKARRAERFISNAGVVDTDDSMFDASTRARLAELRRTDVITWAVEFGKARIAAAERKQQQ